MKIRDNTKQKIDALLLYNKEYWMAADNEKIEENIKKIDSYLSNENSYKYFEMSLLKINILNAEGKNKKALDFALKIIENVPAGQITLPIADIYSETGKLFSILNNYKSANIFFDKAINYYKRMQSNEKLIDTIINKANIYVAIGENNKALEYIQESEKIAKVLAESNSLLEIYDFYCTLYSKIGDDKKALIYYKQYAELFFENHNKVHEKRLNDLMTQYENEKTEKEKRLQYLKNIELKKANATKDKFFSIIAHDLKSPFSAIVSFITLMKLGYDKFPPERIESLINELDSNVKNTYTLLENLLTWSQMQSQEMKYNPENISLNIIVNKVFTTLQAKADEKRIKLINKINSEYNAYADYFMLQTIIRNLVNNAIKFTPEEGTITLFAQKIEGNKIKIAVSDTGVGISKDKLTKLFKIESSFSTYGTNKEKGTGLGLILCKEFAERNKGNISVESELDKGSTFFVEIPKI